MSGTSQYKLMSSENLLAKYKEVEKRSRRAMTLEASLHDFSVLQVISEELARRDIPLPE
jgi:hypothetical protein